MCSEVRAHDRRVLSREGGTLFLLATPPIGTRLDNSDNVNPRVNLIGTMPTYKLYYFNVTGRAELA